MATPILNSGSSVVDFLKSQNKPSDYSSRATLYKTSGLEDRLGAYTGSANQNLAFLKQLQTSTGATLPTGEREGDFIQGKGTLMPDGSYSQPTIDTPTNVTTEPKESWIGKQSSNFDMVNGEVGGGGMTASGALSALGYNIPSPEDISNQALDSQEFKTFQEGQGIKNLGIQSQAAEDVAGLEGQAAQDTKKTIDSFGQRGLYFSGMREGAVNDIVNNLAASKLGVDRDVAQKLLEQGQATKEEFIKIASDIAKDAVTAQGKDRTEALGQLNKLGYAVSPLTGEIVAIPTKGEVGPTSFQEWSLAGGEDGTGKTYNEWLKDEEKSDALTTAQLQAAFDRVSDDFRQDPVVKQYTTAGTGWGFMNKINTSTTNPADDIGMIYAFAKIMDPESVVREGEYAVIQKYAQAWAQTFGFNAARIFSNEKFLTSQALENMKATAGAKFNALQTAFSSAKKTYEQRNENLKNGISSGSLPTYDFGEDGVGGSGGGQIIEYKGKQYQTDANGDFDPNSPLTSVGGDTNQASRAVRNNNPLNIKYSTATSTYSGVAGTDPNPATDGGKFLTFNSPEDGFRAATRLITSTNYINLSVDAALKRWSNKGYGGEIIPELKNKTIAQLDNIQLSKLIKTMAKREGYNT